MGRTNKVLIIIIIFLIIVLAAGGAFAYIYLGTDLLKSDKEMFFKYFTQIGEKENGFLEESIETYNEKKNQQAYENSGEFSITIEGVDEVPESVNDLLISFSGEHNRTGEFSTQDIEIDYGNDVVFPIKYMQSGDIAGLQTDFVGKKYISVENKNLKELAQKFGVTDVSEIPDKIEVSENLDKIEFSEEEKQQLEKIYVTVLNEQLPKESFSKNKDDNGVHYTLSLTGEQIKNLLIKMLEATKQNTLLIDKINEYAKSSNEENDEIIDITLIDTIIEGLNNKLEIPDIKITLVEKDKQLNQIIIENDSFQIELTKTESESQLAYGVAVNVKLGNEESLIDSEVNLALVYSYSGLQNMNNVREACNISIEVSRDDEFLGYIYDIKNTIKFIDNVEVESLNSDNAIILNDYDNATELINKIGERIIAVNKDQMKELGLEESENPLLYTNPISMLAIYNMASNAIGNADLSEYEKQAFNEKFTQYEGVNQRGLKVNALLTTVFNHNLTETDETRKISVTGDANLTTSQTTVPEKVDSTNTYNITMKYNDEGFIDEIEVIKN